MQKHKMSELYGQKTWDFYSCNARNSIHLYCVPQPTLCILQCGVALNIQSFFIFDIFYLTTAMYCNWGQRQSPSVDGRVMVLDDHDQMVSGDKCGLNFMIFVLELRENPGKTSTRKLTRPGFEPGPIGWEVTTLPPRPQWWSSKLVISKILKILISRL